jgi:GNAT superfamily N-acetyltransferase
MTYEPSAVSVRRLETADLSAALAIQSETYPAFLREGAGAFASRLGVAAPYCLAATRGDVVVGYLLAHGWPSQAPPAVGTHLAPDAPSDVLFVHDLATSSAGRGAGIGRKLIGRAFELAAGDGLTIAELIAVEGAASYWRTLGFAPAAAPPALAAKVAAYGPSAVWMTREISPIRG